MKKNLNLTLVLVMIAFATSAQTYKVNPSESSINWTGKKVTGEHIGTIKLKSGAFELKNDKFIEGNFIIDMNSITNTDLTGEWNDKLIGHLKSDDFFSVEKYPEASLQITESGEFVNGLSKVKGNLSIKGITNPIDFEVSHSDDKFSATITVDRTLYNIRYGSGKFFDNLGDKTIYDDFILEVKLVATSKD